MATPVTNFGKVTVSTGYDASATSLVLETGHGSRLPTTFPFPLTWWDATTSTGYTDPADDPSREIVIVTGRTGDTLTVTRAGEGTSATTHNTGGHTYKMVLGITKAMWDSIFTHSLSQDFRGLSMQTHPDNDIAHKTVHLIHADAIVMQDGEEIKDWNHLDMDITASGVGGLDTGSEAASAWYEIHAIYDGTNKKLLGHRAKDYLLDEDITAGEDASQGLRANVDNSTVKVAQGFKVDTAGPLEFVDVKLIKTGTPTGNYWLTVEATSGGVPSNTPLATSNKYDVSRVPTVAVVVRLPFRTPASLSAATQYHIVLQGDYTVSASNFISWRMDGSAATYANGSKALFDSDTSTWTNDTDDDLYLKVYITQNDTAVTLPSGYTQRALIGYAYNNASGNLKHFYQHDRLVMGGFDDDWQAGAFGAGRAFADLFAFVPPVSCTVWFGINNGTSSVLVIGQLSSTDVDNTVLEHVGTVRANVTATFENGMPPLSMSAYQGMPIDVGAGTMNTYMASFEW